MVAGSLQADSDMDGLTDQLERQLSLDPLNSRSPASNGFNDKLCSLFPTQCARGCTEVNPTNPFEFKACEKDLLKTVAGASEYHSDFDGAWSSEYDRTFERLEYL